MPTPPSGDGPISVEAAVRVNRAVPRWRSSAAAATLLVTPTYGGQMRGTLACAVTKGGESAEALALSAELSERLGLRLVLAHAVDGIGAFGNGDGVESATMQADRQGRRAATGAPRLRARRRRPGRAKGRRPRAGSAARSDCSRGGRRPDRRRVARTQPPAPRSRKQPGPPARDRHHRAGCDRAAEIAARQRGRDVTAAPALTSQ